MVRAPNLMSMHDTFLFRVSTQLHVLHVHIMYKYMHDLVPAGTLQLSMPGTQNEWNPQCHTGHRTPSCPPHGDLDRSAGEREELNSSNAQYTNL